MSAINTYLETGEGPSLWLVRIKPDSIRGSHMLRRPAKASFTKAGGWTPLEQPSRDMLLALATTRESNKSGSPLVFDVCSPQEARELEARETTKARARSGKRTVAEAIGSRIVEPKPAARPQAAAEKAKPAPTAEAPRGRGRPPKRAPEPIPEPEPEQPPTPDEGIVDFDVDDDDDGT